MTFPSHEPPFEEDDTRPTQTIDAVEITPPWKAIIGLVSLLAALGFTVATVFLLLNPPEDTSSSLTPETPAVVASEEALATDDSAEAIVQNTAPAAVDAAGDLLQTLPTVDPLSLQNQLALPLEPADTASNVLVSDAELNPFTIIPDRPRDEMEQYTVVQGDTIESIATRFGLESESIVWSNPRRIIQVLRPGDVLNIPPVDGVFVYAQGVENTLADYAARYEVDIAAVLSHPANRAISNLAPSTVPQSGTPIFFPGGQAEVIVWQAAIEVTGAGGNGTSGGATPTVRFQPGDPGDCGSQAIVGGTQWVNPVPAGYTITRGYSSYHPGMDLANSTGTVVVAANGGRVIFAGWNNYGYGRMVAIIHGPTMTVYGHLDVVQVSCGQDVGAGQQIGLMGSTGNSSGPHLHFEIRGAPGYLPYNPSATIGF